MLLDDRPYTFDRVTRLLLGTGGMVLGVWLLTYLSDVLVPFVVAFVLAYLLNPLVCAVQKRLKYRAAAVFATLAGALAALALALLLVIPLVRAEMADMARLLGEVVQNADLPEKLAHYVPPNLWEDAKGYATQEELVELLKNADFWALSEKVARKVLPGAWGLFSGAASLLLGLLGLFVVVLYLVFMLLDYQRVKDDWEELIPPQYREPVLSFLREFDRAMSRHFRAQAVVASIVGVLFAIGFWLVGLPMGIPFGLSIGLLNMVPYLQLAALLPATLLALMKALETGGGFVGPLALTALVFVVVQGIQDSILTPRIQGKVTGLSPAMILLSMSVWGKLLGFLGLVIALPMTCLVLAYYRQILARARSETTRPTHASTQTGPEQEQAAGTRVRTE